MYFLTAVIVFPGWSQLLLELSQERVSKSGGSDESDGEGDGTRRAVERDQSVGRNLLTLICRVKGAMGEATMSYNIGSTTTTASRQRGEGHLNAGTKGHLPSWVNKGARSVSGYTNSERRQKRRCPEVVDLVFCAGGG